MFKVFIFTLLIFFKCYSEESFKVNCLNINELIDKYASIDKAIYILPDNDSIILYKDGWTIHGVSRMSEDKSKEFHLSLPKPLILYELPQESHYDYYKTRKMEIIEKATLVKSVAGIFNAQYIFDQNSRIIKYSSEDQDIIFLNRTGYSRLNFQGKSNHSVLLIRTGGILGTLDSFVVKDLEGSIILVVIEDKPYIPVLDLEGSLRKILDLSGKEVASIIFSTDGNIVKSAGLINAPYCFKGMYREKISEIYFDEKSCYDADLGCFLDFKKPSLAEFDQEVEF